MPILLAKTKPKIELSAVVIRSDGRREPLGVVASTSWRWRVKNWLRRVL